MLRKLVENNRENFKKAFDKEYVTGVFYISDGGVIYEFKCNDKDCLTCPLGDFCSLLSENGNYNEFVLNFKEISNEVVDIFKEFTDPVIIKK